MRARGMASAWGAAGTELQLAGTVWASTHSPKAEKAAEYYLGCENILGVY